MSIFQKLVKVIKIYISISHGTAVLTSNNSEPTRNWKECLGTLANRIFSSVDQASYGSQNIGS